MTAMATFKHQEFRFGNENFPIVYEDERVQIFLNSSREIFIERKDKSKGQKVEMRINAVTDGLEFTTDSRVDPVRVSNTIGWKLHKK